MASMEEKIKAVEDSIFGLRTQLDKFANDIETTRQDNMRVIEEKTMGIEQDSQAAHVKVNQLYEIANKTITMLSDRVKSPYSRACSTVLGSGPTPTLSCECP